MTGLLTLYQLSLSTRLPRRWLRAEALGGRIPCLRIGRSLRFSVHAVAEVLACRAASERINAEGVGVAESREAVSAPVN